MSSVFYGGSIRMNPEVEEETSDPMFEGGYPYSIPKVYLDGAGESYFPQWCFNWDNDSVVVVRENNVVKYTKSAYLELLAKNEEGKIVWMDGRSAPYSTCWDGEYLGEEREAYEYTITEYDLNELKKRKYKVVLAEENYLDNWELDSLSEFGVENTFGSHFEIKDGVLLRYIGKDRDIIIPDDVIEIGADSFKGCSEFNSITIPKTLEKISCIGREGCHTKHLEVATDNPKYYIQDGCLIDREEKELVWAYSGSTIPDDGSILKIGRNAFFWRSDLSRIVIPDAIVEIGDNAFGNCNALKEIVISDFWASDAKRIFGRGLESDGEKGTFVLKKFEGFSF